MAGAKGIPVMSLTHMERVVFARVVVSCPSSAFTMMSITYARLSQLLYSCQCHVTDMTTIY